MAHKKITEVTDLLMEFRTEILNKLYNIDNKISKISEQLFETQKLATIAVKTADEALMLTNENKQQLQCGAKINEKNDKF